MNVKQVAALVVFALGLGMLFASHYIATQVLEGKGKIVSAQSKVDTGKKVFSLVPGTKTVGNQLTNSAQSQIDQGKEEVAYYEQMSNWIRVGGVVALVLGAAAFFLCRSKKRG